MNDGLEGTEGTRPDSSTRAAAKGALRRVGKPFTRYFDHRFRDLHEHLDSQPALQQFAAATHERFDHLRRDLQQTREEVANDADTIAELAFTLERFADHFTARMEELAAAFRPDERPSDTSVIELPFAYAAAGSLDAGVTVATIGGDTALPRGLAALGLRVTAIRGNSRLSQHPDVVVVDEDADRWKGPVEPLHGFFALSDAWTASSTPTPALLDLCRKWLRPDGFVVLAFPSEAIPAGLHLRELLADWVLERQEVFAPTADGVWRRQGSHADQSALPSLVMVKAVPPA